MKDIFIKYNPYKVETEVTIDGATVKKNSELNVGDRRLQEWIEELPQILYKEFNTKSFQIKFHGTELDFEDIQWVAQDANKFDFNLSTEHIPAREVKDKEQAIAKVFKDIQQGPFDELKKPDVINAFNMAYSSEFPVIVVATMSAGKSTLINALLHKKLMPSKHEACTAIITEIKDNDGDVFKACVYDKDNELIESIPCLTYEKMEKLNKDINVSTIHSEGNIPFVESDNMALVLIDTPGPNSARCPEHQAVTYKMLNESSKTVVLYLLNATSLEVNDDNNLLTHVAESMKVGGKQSRDRFIFVVNKLDEFKKDEDSVDNSLNKVKKYLEDKGVNNPNIFPASSLTALYIRSVLKDINIASIDLNDVKYDGIRDEIDLVSKMNRRQDLHFEKYAPLPNRLKVNLSTMLADARKASDLKQEALIHTGIVSIESAIHMYLTKYAKTAKIKNIVDTFAQRLESSRSFENTKQEIASSTEKKIAISKQIETLKTKLNSGEEALKFKRTIDVINLDEEVKNFTKSIINDAQKKIEEKLSISSNKMTNDEAKNSYYSFAQFTESLFAKVSVELEDAVNKHVLKTAQSLITEYKNKIAELSHAVDDSIPIVPGSWISISINKVEDVETIIGKSKKDKPDKVPDGYELVPIGLRDKINNTWFMRTLGLKLPTREKEIQKFKEIYYIDGSDLAKRYFAPIQKQLWESESKAIEHTRQQTEDIKRAFNKKFDDLNAIINGNLNELKACVTNNDDLSRVLKETQSRLSWLTNIQERINGILDI